MRSAYYVINPIDILALLQSFINDSIGALNETVVFTSSMYVHGSISTTDAISASNDG